MGVQSLKRLIVNKTTQQGKWRRLPRKFNSLNRFDVCKSIHFEMQDVSSSLRNHEAPRGAIWVTLLVDSYSLQVLKSIKLINLLRFSFIIFNEGETKPRELENVSPK